jgi:acyl-lipid omega-6 desaturase (Delta-12 desaturase)
MTSDSIAAPGATLPTGATLRALIREYEVPSHWRAAWQIINTFVPYVAVWVLMYFSRDISWWLTVPLAFVAAALLVRIFIFFHDCGHGSFFKSRLANDITGFITGVLTVTPYYHWRWEHGLHHGTAGNLDRRGVGDIWTMTVQEYLESSRWRKFAYRLARNPLILFVLAPVFVFLFMQRLPTRGASARERESVWWMNLAILLMAIGLSAVFGVVDYLIIQVILVAVSGTAGIWLFYVQHQFDGVYWERHKDWDYRAAALHGSSFYKLPAVLRWLSGNIGYHHIHHLSSRIPNYNLKRCHDRNPILQQVRVITLWESLRTARYRLWDEKLRKLVGFVHLRNQRNSST